MNKNYSIFLIVLAFISCSDAIQESTDYNMPDPQSWISDWKTMSHIPT